MARQILTPFAEDGDKVSIPETAQPDGSVSYEEGYTFDYSRPVSDPSSKNMERVKLNALMADITEILQQFQQQGAAEWYADTTYTQFARVKHGGSYYVALIDGTEEEPGTGSEWVVNNVAAAARLNNVSATTDPTANDDETEGYEPLSTWINTVSGEIFIAITVAEGAANWQQGTLTIDELGNVALLNANAIGQAIIQSANPSAIRFLRANADNSISWLSAADYRTALSLGTAALVNTGTGLGDVPLTSQLNTRLGTTGNLGSAALATVTASAFDTTVGRVTLVGDGGLLGLATFQSGYDFNATGQVMQGRTLVSASPGTKPSTDIPGFPDNCFVLPAQRSSGGNMVQLAIAFEGTTSRMAHRHYSGTTWSLWAEDWTNRNLVKVTSSTDVTAGSVTTVGYAGWGILQTPASTDANALTVPGAYQLTTGASGDFSNYPSWAAPSRSSVLVLGNKAPYGVDQYFDRLNGRSAYRVWNTTAGNWLEYITTGNTSANVQTMLAAADNAAIRTALSVPVNSSGTFTPVAVGTTTPGTATYTVQVGRYERIGNRVFMTIRLSWGGHTGSGSIDITGLPFTSNVNNRTVWGIRAFGLIAEGGSQILGETVGSSTLIELRSYDPLTGNSNFCTIEDNVNVSTLVLNGVMEI